MSTNPRSQVKDASNPVGTDANDAILFLDRALLIMVLVVISAFSPSVGAESDVKDTFGWRTEALSGDGQWDGASDNAATKIAVSWVAADARSVESQNHDDPSAFVRTIDVNTSFGVETEWTLTIMDSDNDHVGVLIESRDDAGLRRFYLLLLTNTDNDDDGQPALHRALFAEASIEKIEGTADLREWIESWTGGATAATIKTPDGLRVRIVRESSGSAFTFAKGRTFLMELDILPVAGCDTCDGDRVARASIGRRDGSQIFVAEQFVDRTELLNVGVYTHSQPVRAKLETLRPAASESDS